MLEIIGANCKCGYDNTSNDLHCSESFLLLLKAWRKSKDNNKIT